MTPDPVEYFCAESKIKSNKTATTIYDDLRPKNEPRYLQKIRGIEKAMGFLTPLKWGNIIHFTLSHLVILTWLGHNLYNSKLPKWQTLLYGVSVSYFMSALGVTAGVHRYWTHRSYKATLPLQLTLAICFYMGPIWSTIREWVRDHRVHHKFSETSADPHDATRGFFFAHMGWLMMNKHPDVIREGRKIDMSDIDNDPVIKFHTKYHIVFKLLFAVVLPIAIPPLTWGESWELSTLQQFFYINVFDIHVNFAVNSFAHLWGNKPYNPHINPADNWWVSLFAMGEGFHNYHHTFPWDYKTSELPYFINLTTLVLDGFVMLGWAYDMKTATPHVVHSTIRRTSKK